MLDYMGYFIMTHDGDLNGPYESIGEAEGWAYDFNLATDQYCIVDNNGNQID